MGLTITGRLILASASPRREELLRLAGLTFEIRPSGADENALPGEAPREHVLRLSEKKALSVAILYPDAWVLGADTIVVVDGEVLGKPETKEDAYRMLKRLSGRYHTVFTGFALIRHRGGKVRCEAVESAVLFKKIPDDEIIWYINTPEPHDKAGSYAVQGMGAYFIKEIRGSYTNVMGLPLCEVMETLKAIGMISFSGIACGSDHPTEH
jgi:septum formation protein